MFVCNLVSHTVSRKYTSSACNLDFLQAVVSRPRRPQR